METVVVTGATGFIGKNLVKLLLSKGCHVYGVGTDVEKLNRLEKMGNFTPVVATFEDYEHIVLNIPQVDVFYHLAWSGTSSLNDIDIQMPNIQASVSAVRLASKVNSKRFIFVSTNYQFMNFKCNRDICASVYGISKKCAQDLCEVMCFNLGLEYCAALLGNTFGPGDYSNKSVNTFVRKLCNDENLDLVSGQDLDDWMYISETVKGLYYLGNVANVLPKCYVGHKEITTFKYKLLTMARIFKSKSVLNFGSYVDKVFVDYTKLKDMTIPQDCFGSITFEESLMSLRDWLHSINRV